MIIRRLISGGCDKSGFFLIFVECSIMVRCGASVFPVLQRRRPVMNTFFSVMEGEEVKEG